MNDFDYENEIIEISDDAQGLENEILNFEEPKIESPKKNNKSLKEKWNNLSKRNKIIIIVSAVVVLLSIIGLVLYFVVFKNDDAKNNVEENIVVEKDNYRYENGKLVFLNKKDKEIGTYTCKTKDSEKCFVTRIDYSNDLFDRTKNVDKKGNEIEKTSQIYLDNYVFVTDEEKVVLYNIDKKETELELKSIKSYSTEKDLVVIEDEDNKFGLIEITEEGFEYLIRCSYDYLGIVNTKINYLVAKDKDETYIIDSEGKKLSDNINNEIKSVNEEYIVAKSKDSYNLYSYDYEELISDYDYIGIHDKVISLVKGNRLFLVNNNLSKLYEDGIRLENQNYVKEYVYDNNKLIETKKSYDIKVVGNIATITIGNEDTEINIAEGDVSSSLSYVNYFDGKLYFYSDEEKQDLLGTYTCKNKNELLSGESTLNKCHLFSNESGVSGIYNNEYVFIYDNESINDAKYYLYSIKEKKTKGTYSSIEFVNADELSNNIKQNYTSSSFVIAKAATGNNKGNFGVLEINSDRVSGKVEFKYESIKKEKNNYLLINVDKSYSIYDSSFKKISNEFAYIELFDEYYVGINSGRLNVYRYNNTLGILQKDLECKDNKFTIDFSNGFALTIGGKTYKYDKDGKEIKENPLGSILENNNSNSNSEEGE